MKQYTTPEQTAKLIELGFKPDSIEFASDCEVVNEYGIERIECINPQFSVGELIEVLPDEIYVDENTYSKVIDKTGVCYYSWELEIYAISICDVQEELIDNLYDMVVKLNEKGLI